MSPSSVNDLILTRIGSLKARKRANDYQKELSQTSKLQQKDNRVSTACSRRAIANRRTGNSAKLWSILGI
jgi:hypothetical protein